MSKLYIRVKKDGFIYDYNELLAKNASCEVVTEEVAYPERFIPEHAVERVQELQKPKVVRKKKVALDLSTADIPEAPTYNNPELASEASRGLP
jgi:hypothetical protein